MRGLKQARNWTPAKAHPKVKVKAGIGRENASACEAMRVRRRADAAVITGEGKVIAAGSRGAYASVMQAKGVGKGLDRTIEELGQFACAILDLVHQHIVSNRTQIGVRAGMRAELDPGSCHRRICSALIKRRGVGKRARSHSFTPPT